MSDNPDDETESKNNLQGGFFVTLLKKVIWMIIFLFVGIAMLYGCKVAAANLIPTTLGNCDINFDTVEKKGKMISSERLSCVQPEEIPDTTTVNVTIANNKQGVPYSKRLTFNYKEIYEKYINTGILKYLKLMQNGNKASKGTAFLSSMIETAMFANFSIFDKFYKMMNNAAASPLAETLVIFILPIIFMYIYPLFIIVNMFLFVGSFFFNLSIFTKKRYPEAPETPPMETEWQNYDPDDDAAWSTFGKFLLYLGGFFMMGIPLMVGSICGMAFPIYAIIYPLFVAGTVKGQPYNFGNFLTDMLKFKKHVIMYYFSFNVIMGAYNNSGENGAATAMTAFLAILFIWVFDKMFGVFTPYDWEKNDSKVMTVMTGQIPSDSPPSKPSSAGSGPRQVPSAPPAPTQVPSAPPAPTQVPSAPPAPSVSSGAVAAAALPISSAPTVTNMVDQTQESAPAPAQVPGVNPKTADEQSQEAAVQQQQSAGQSQEAAVQQQQSAGQSQEAAVQQQQAVQSQEAEVGTTNPYAVASPVPGSPEVEVGGGKTTPPDNEGMLGFATRLFDTIIKEPLLGKNKKPEIQSGGKVKSNGKNMRTRKSQ